MALCSPRWLGAFLNPQPHGGKVSWAQCQQDMTAQPEDANKPPSLTGWPGAAAHQARSQRSSFRHRLLFTVIYKVDLTEEEVATSTQNLNHGSLKPPFTSRIAGKTDTYQQIATRHQALPVVHSAVFPRGSCVSGIHRQPCWRRR